MTAPVEVLLLKRVEATSALGPGVGLLGGIARLLTGSPSRMRALQGNFIGHASTRR